MATHSQSVIIVEDEARLREPLQEALTAEGFHVLTAANGREGLELILKHRPDLVLLDIVMPAMSGLAVLHEIRLSQTHAHVPVILLTNVAASEEIAQAVEEEVVGYFIKSDWSLRGIVDDINSFFANGR